MKIDGNRLDPGNLHEREWLAWNQQKRLTKLGGDGTPVIGIFGKRNGKDMTGMGLFFGERGAPETK